jgi:hypothetical protein
MKANEFFITGSAKERVFMGQNPDERIIEVLRRGFIVELKWLVPVVIILFLLLFGEDVLKGFYTESSVPIVPFSDKFYFTLRFGLIIATLCFAFNRYADWYYSVNIITNHRVLDFEFVGLGIKKIVETELKNIQSISVANYGLWSFIFGLSTIHILTSGDNPNINFEFIPDSKKIQDLLSDLSRNPRRD